MGRICTYASYLNACIVMLEKNKGTVMGRGRGDVKIKPLGWVVSRNLKVPPLPNFDWIQQWRPPMICNQIGMFTQKRMTLVCQIPTRWDRKSSYVLRQIQSSNLLELVFGIPCISTPASFIPSKIRYPCFCSFYCTTWTSWRSWCHMRSMITRCGAISKEALCGKF